MIRTLSSLDFSGILNWDSTTYSGELIMSFIVMGVIAVLSFVVYFNFRHADPTKPDKNKFVTLVSKMVEMVDGYTVELMGKKWSWFASYAFCLFVYIIFCFVIGVSGLPNPLVNLSVPFSLGLITFLMIHITAIKANKWNYYKRYLDPFPVMLPINLLSMWAPLLSVSLRLFGNAFSGYCLMSIVYYFLRQLSALIFSSATSGSIWIAPLITPFLHVYFDLFSGFIQALIFASLTMIWVSQEDPEEEEVEQASVKTDAVMA